MTQTEPGQAPELPPLPPKWSQTVTEPPSAEQVEVETADDAEARRSGGTFVGRYLHDRQSEIDAAETARVEALLQVCQLAAPGKPLADTGTAIFLITGIQYDAETDPEARVHVYERAIGALAYRWHELPVDARTVIEAALIPQARMADWEKERAKLVFAAGGLNFHERADAFARSVLGL